MKRFLSILFFVVILLGLLSVAAYFVYDYFTDSIEDVTLSIERNVDEGFLKYDETHQLIVDVCDTVNNINVISIPLDSVEEVLRQNPWVTDVKTDIDLNSVLNVEVVECEPVMRLYNKERNSIYLDSLGNIFPDDNEYKPRLLIGSGHADFPTDKLGNVNDEIYAATDLPSMFKIVSSVLENDYSRCCVKQVFLDKNKNFKFSMNNTDIIVIFGDDNNIDEKLFKLEHFFMKMQGNPELDNYKEININFNNQVVCTKSKVR